MDIKNGVELALIEIEFTDIIQTLIDYGNEYVFKNFKYHLVMDNDFEESLV